jgi:hypothetical protein
MIPWQDIDNALGGHGAKFASLGLLRPVVKDGAAYVEESEWLAFQSRMGVPTSQRPRDWAEAPASRPAALIPSRGYSQRTGNQILDWLRQVGGARFKR